MQRPLYTLLIILSLLTGLIYTTIPVSLQADASPSESIENPSDDTVDPNPPHNPALQGPDNCAVGVAPVVFHADDPYPSTAIEPQDGILAYADFFDVSYPSPDGRNREVSAGDTLVLYLYMINGTGVATAESPCNTEVADVEITDIRVSKTTTGEFGNMMSSMVWPNVSQPGLLTTDSGVNRQTYGLFTFEALPTDTNFRISVTVEYTCTASYCSTGPFTKTISYPSPDSVTLSGQTYDQVYGGAGNVDIRVVGPKANVQVLSPTSGTIANPYQVVPYVIRVTSLDNADDAIVRLTDSTTLGEEIPQCDDSTYDASPTSGNGWYEDNPPLPNPPTQKVDSGDLAGANGPSFGALDTNEIIYCYFTVVMNPAIINNTINNSFTLSGVLIATDPDGQTVRLPVNAPPVVIADAAVSITKTIVSPPVQDGAVVGQDVTYRFVITNTGQVPLDGFIAVDSLLGVLNIPNTTLQPGESLPAIIAPYRVGLTDISPLVNTVTVQAHPVGAPQNFIVEASAAATIPIQGSELTTELILFEVDGVAYNPADPNTSPRPGSVLTYRVEYCNQSSETFTDLTYVSGYPVLIDGPRPTYVDSDLLNGAFGAGCYPSGLGAQFTEFTYTVPPITSINFADPVINTIRVRARGATGAFKYAEFTLVTNVVSDDVEISAFRYTLDNPGVPVDSSSAALRGETLFYHVDIRNLSGTALCNVEIRQYTRNSQGNLIPDNPFVIPDEYILWDSGVGGRLEPETVAGDTAASIDLDNLRITYNVTGETIDPFYRVFEVYAPQPCTGSPFTEPFIDRAAVETDISDVQVNTVISVFAQPTNQGPLEFGFLEPGLQYSFNYSATNVGITFQVDSLQYCFLVSGCTLVNFPGTAPNFFETGPDFQPFETRSDTSGIYTLTGDEPTPLRIQVILKGKDGLKDITVRTIYSFPLLTSNIPGGIVFGDTQLVRGDGPAPYNYLFTNETEGILNDVRVLNLLETSPTEQPGFYERVGVPGFSDTTYYEVCQVHGQILDGSVIGGTCNLTYGNNVPGGQFQMQVLVVGTLAANGQKVISIGLWEVEEIQHLLVEKTGPGVVAVNSSFDWTIQVTNQSKYQPVRFNSTDGFVDTVTPELPPGFTPPVIAEFVNAASDLVDLGGGNYLLPRLGSATLTRTISPPTGGFTGGYTNTATFVGTTDPNPDAPTESVPGRQVTGTATTTVRFACPIEFVGFFIDPNPYPFPDLDGIHTVGESRGVQLFYGNFGTEPLNVTNVTDSIFERENGRPLNLSTDVTWPNPSQPGLLLPNEFFYYESPVIIRPIDIAGIAEDIIEFSWLATISLQAGQISGCDNFTVEWFYDIANPILIDKVVRPGTGLIQPGSSVGYQIFLQNISDQVNMQVSSLEDSLLPTIPLALEFESGATGLTGKLNNSQDQANDEANMLENGVQDVYVVTPTDPVNLLNIATINFYVANDGVGPANLERGPSFPMLNIDDASIVTANPLELTIVPSLFEAAAGTRIDIDVSITNLNSLYPIQEIFVTTGDDELAAGLAAAVDPLFLIPTSLSPSQSIGWAVRTPYYQIPTDYAEDTLEICAQATGTLITPDPVPLPQVVTCVEIIITPPELEVEKLAFADNTCTFPLEDSDANDVGEVSVGESVFYRVTVTNNSSDKVFDNITFIDTTNDGGDLSQALQAAFESANGGSRTLNIGAEPVTVCVQYPVTETAFAEPILTNTVRVEATTNNSSVAVEDEVSVDVVDANISITKRADVNVAFPGTTIRYTLTIRNRNEGNAALILADVWDSLLGGQLNGPPDFHQTCVENSIQPPNFLDCDPSITSIPFNELLDTQTGLGWVWPDENQVGVIPSGEVATYTYEYVVQPSDPDPLVNEAGVVAYLYDPTTTPSWTLTVLPTGNPQDRTQANVAITNSQLLVRKTASPTSALVGTRVVYQIAITNIGTRPVTEIEVVDCHPAVPCDFNEDPFTVAFGGTSLTDQIVPPNYQDTLNPFRTAVINTYSLIMPTAGEVTADPTLDPYVNTVFARGQVSIDGSGNTQFVPPGSDTASVDLLIPGIRITKSPSVGSASVGDSVDYTIQVFNTGDGPMRLDSVEDITDTGSPIPIATMRLNGCGASDPQITVGPSSGDRLQPGEFACAVITLTITAPPAGSSEFVNRARVQATVNPGDVGESALEDNTSAIVDVRDLDLVLTVSKQAYSCNRNDAGCTNPTLVTQVTDGDTYVYEIRITNISASALTQVEVSDPDLNNGTPIVVTDFTQIGDNDATFDPNETVTIIYDHTANLLVDTVGASNAYTNTATVVGTLESGEETEPRQASYTVIIRPVDLSVEKVACVGVQGTPPDFGSCVVATPYAQPGDYIWYQVSITNMSQRNVSNIVVDDTLKGTLDNNDPLAVWPGGVPGALPACQPPNPCPTALLTYVSDDAVATTDTSITNTAVATGFVGSIQTFGQASVTVYVSFGDLVVTIVEDAGRTEAIAGTQLNFTITVRNLGIDPIDSVNVRLPFIDGNTPLNPTPLTLGAGQSQTFTRTYLVSNADTVMNFEAIADGVVAGINFPISDTDVWTVVRVVPGVAISKTASTNVADIGDTITYTITVENTNAAGTSITNLQVQDSLFDVSSNPWPTQIPAGAIVTRQYDYTIIGDEGNPVINTVTVTGQFGTQPFVVSDIEEVFLASGNLLVTNTPSTTSANVGDTVSFLYQICNISTGTSPTDDLTNVTLADDDGTFTLPNTTLVPGQCFNAVRDVVLADTDVPEITYTVIGTATSATGDLAQAVARTVTVVPDEAGGLRLEVIPSAPVAYLGSPFDIDFIIRNVGLEPLTITQFNDIAGIYTSYNPVPVNTLLPVGGTLIIDGVPILNIDVNTPDPLVATWTVTARNAANVSFTHSDGISIPIVTNPDATVALSYVAQPPSVLPGGTVTYTYRVRNISPIPVTAQLQQTATTCTTYTPGTEALWQLTGAVVLPNAIIEATATCQIADDFANLNVTHTVEVLDLNETVNPQDVANIITPVESTLEIEILDSLPLVWRVENPVSIRYRIANTSATTAITNVVAAISTPTPCEDQTYFEDATFTIEAAFTDQLSAQQEVFVECVYDVLADDFASVTVEAEVSGQIGAVSVNAEITRDFDVVDLGLQVVLTGEPANDANTASEVEAGDTVEFTLTLTNTGLSPLDLPLEAEEPVSSQVYEEDDPTNVLGNLGDDLYTYLADGCDWPLEAQEECVITAADVAEPGLRFTTSDDNPIQMLATVQLELREAVLSERIAQEATWGIELMAPSLNITTIVVNPPVGVVGQTVEITAIILNNGEVDLQNLAATLVLEQVTGTTFVPHQQGDIVLTSTRRQSNPIATIPMTFVTGTSDIASGAQVTVRGIWTVDRAGTIRATVNASAQTVVTSAQATVTATSSVTFTTQTSPTSTNDPNNPLNPNALDPEITKSVSPESAFPNQEMTFTIEVRNPSTTAMSNISVVDAVPDAFPVVSAATTQGASIVNGQLVSVTTGRLDPGATVTITIVVTVGPETPVPSLWTNEACANIDGRSPVCAEVEIAIGVGEDGMLPTTGLNSAPEKPMTQGVSGVWGILPLLSLVGLLMMANSANRRWLIAGGILVLIMGIVVAVVLILAEDEDSSPKDQAAAITSPTVTVDGTERATLARRPSLTPMSPTETPTLSPLEPSPTILPIVPTLRPSPTPYILPTASGPRSLYIPKLNLTRPIPIVELPYVENTWDVSELGYNAGFLQYTTWLDPTWGNTVIVAHVQLDAEDPGPFYRLGDVEVGDEVVIYEGDQEFHFRVSEIEIVHATAVEVTHPTADPILTLLTCTNWDMAAGVFSDRLVVRAVPIES